METDEGRIVREVRAWLDEHWRPDRPLAEWRGLLADSGWAAPTWPEACYGRGLSAAAAAVVDRAFDEAGAVGAAGGAGRTLAAPTILEYGPDELRLRLLRPILTGEHRWCQLFSEPGNGSDLAGLTTRAERDGDEWVVNGQKVWTTGARTAAYGMLLARTDWDVPKHRGLTFFALPMQQPGVEVRPLRQMNGYASFNEVFLTDARVPHVNVVGEVGGGWRAALTTLSHERGLPTARHLDPEGQPDRGRTWAEAEAEAADYAATYVWYPQRAGRTDLVVTQARAANLDTDPLVRQAIADLLSLDRTARWTATRARAARVEGRPGPEGSIGKLVGSEIARRAAALHARLAGADALLSGPDAVLEGIVAEILVSVPGQSIAGGTDEIQRNIVGERSLGLPREPSVDNDVAFREVRTNTSRR